MEIMTKKGFFFSLFVITALSLVVFTFRIKAEFKEEQRAEIFKARVEQTDRFIEDMEEDMERSLYVTSFRAFLGIDEYIHMKEDYLAADEFDDIISELILNGTINGIQMNVTDSSTFSDWTERMRELARRFNIDVTFNDIKINADHISPWKINISFESNVSVTDFEDVIGWNFSLGESTIIDIGEVHFSDPVYYIGSLENLDANTDTYTKPLTNNIEKTPYNDFWVNETAPCTNPDCIDAANLIDHTTRQLYRNNIKAPSYLMRLEGDFGPSPYGIESFVNVINTTRVWEYSHGGIETCAVDYQFFTSAGCSEKHRIINMDDKFYLDWEHIEDYNLTKINST